LDNHEQDSGGQRALHEFEIPWVFKRDESDHQSIGPDKAGLNGFVVVIVDQLCIQINTAQGGGSSVTATVNSTPSVSETGSARWTRWHKIGAFVVGAATITSAVMAMLQIL
jgi:hypothetical protein